MGHEIELICKLKLLLAGILLISNQPSNAILLLNWTGRMDKKQ